MTKAEVLEVIMDELCEMRGPDEENWDEDAYYAIELLDNHGLKGLSRSEFCPNDFEYLKNAETCNNSEGADCTQCWKNAVEAKIRGEI